MFCCELQTPLSEEEEAEREDRPPSEEEVLRRNIREEKKPRGRSPSESVNLFLTVPPVVFEVYIGAFEMYLRILRRK